MERNKNAVQEMSGPLPCYQHILSALGDRHVLGLAHHHRPKPRGPSETSGRVNHGEKEHVRWFCLCSAQTSFRYQKGSSSCKGNLESVPESFFCLYLQFLDIIVPHQTQSEFFIWRLEPATLQPVGSAVTVLRKMMQLGES